MQIRISNAHHYCFTKYTRVLKVDFFRYKDGSTQLQSAAEGIRGADRCSQNSIRHFRQPLQEPHAPRSTASCSVGTHEEN